MTRIALFLSLIFAGQPELGPVQDAKGKTKPAAVGEQAVLPEAFRALSVADAIAGDQGWTDGVVRNAKGALWIRKAAALERYPSATAVCFVSLDKDGWVLWLTPTLRLRPTPDEEIDAKTCIKIRGLDYRLMENKE